MPGEPIVFYDIPTTDTVPKSWSPNTWKTRYESPRRYVLNIKGIPYRTVWVEYPDIAPLMRKIGAPPTERRADGSPKYTLPALYDPNTRTAVAESAAIARYLDSAYPDTHRVIPAETDALHAAFDAAFLALSLEHLVPLIVPEVPAHLRPRSEAYFRATREVELGGPLQDVAPPGPKRERHWAGLRSVFGTFAQWLRADGVEKPFFLGESIGYADVVLASFVLCFRILHGEDSEEWTEIKSWDEGRWVRLVDAFKQFETVDDGEDAVL